jgi:ubiquinone/menaquinone biosynthesis C-methylase UbiE
MKPFSLNEHPHVAILYLSASLAMLRVTSNTPEKWKPKQCVKVTPSTFQEMSGDLSQQIAKHIINLVAPFPPGSIVHDNACGKGVISQEIIEATDSIPNTSQDVFIHATDFSQLMVDECRNLAISRGWTSRMWVERMGMQDLTFSDETFSHSFTNFAIFALSDPEAAKAAEHIHRSLRKGGTAFLTVWAETPTAVALTEAHWTTRSRTDDLQLFSKLYWHQDTHVRKVLVDAGFPDDQVEISQKEVFMDIRDMDRWSQVVWTLAGRPADGWMEKDEDMWEEATKLIKESIRQSKGFQVTETGECGMRCVVNIAVATK